MIWRKEGDLYQKLSISKDTYCVRNLESCYILEVLNMTSSYNQDGSQHKTVSELNQGHGSVLETKPSVISGEVSAWCTGL